MLGSVRGVVSNDHSYRDKANPRVLTPFRARKATRFGRTIARSERPGGTRMSVDPVYKVARSGARVEEMRWRDRTVIDGILGIDVCKNTLDVSISSYTKVRTKSFTNSPDGWRHLLDWLIAQKIQRVHACLESTGRYSLGIACALYEADHVV